MKRIIPIFSLFALLFTACDSEEFETLEEITKEQTKEAKKENTDIDPNNPNNPVQESVLEISKTPCSFTIDSLSPNDVIDIDCQIDLKGATIQLPKNITLNYNGGEIINGTLNFSEGIIDGKLLNHTLNITGNGQLNSINFFFYPERWNIVGGKTSNKIALQNKLNLQKAIDQVKAFSFTTSKKQIFSINNLDAYFRTINEEWVDSYGYNRSAIHLPSDFHLKMSNNTFLREQPNRWPRGIFIGIYEEKNVLVSGGNLIGDRFSHVYTPIKDEVGIARNSHEWHTLIVVAGCKDILLEGIHMAESTGDGFIAGATKGFRHTGGPNKKFNTNITVRNCVIESSRRNNISVTDGEDIYIENCTIKDAGNGDSVLDTDGNKIFSAAGVAPRVGIDIEPFRGYNDDGSFRDFEIVDRTTISGCTFINNNVASIIDYSGLNTTIKNNTSDHGFFASFSTGTQFLNNTLKASIKNKDIVAITTGAWLIKINGVDTELSKNNKVIGNTIEGFRVGVTSRGNDGLVSNNIITDFEYGIQVKNTTNFTYNNNKMLSTQTNSIGIAIANTFAKDLLFTKSNITVPRKPIEIYVVNNTAKHNSNKLTFTGKSIFKSTEGRQIFIKDTPNVEISNSTLTNTGIKTENVSNLIDQDNIRN